MKKSVSLLENPEFDEKHPSIQILVETVTSKEIRILFREGQILREHRTPFPIVILIFKGAVNFGIQGERVTLEEGDLIALETGMLHDLVARKESIIRLSLSRKMDIENLKKRN